MAQVVFKILMQECHHSFFEKCKGLGAESDSLRGTQNNMQTRTDAKFFMT